AGFGDPSRTVARWPADRAAADRPSVRRRDAGCARHRVPGGDRSSPQDTDAAMSPIVEIENLHVRFHGERTVYALNGVDITLEQGEVLGLLGESGSGKSVTLRALLRMLPPRRSRIDGSIRLAGEDVLALAEARLEHLR